MPLSSQQTADIQKQFDPMRRRLQQQEAANLQTQKDALARRAAASGGGPSGAFVKQEQLATDASARRLQDANEGVDAQQMAAINQARQVQEGRDYQTAERLGSEKFAAGESALQRRLQERGLGIQEAGLTGLYAGKETLAARQAADQKALAEAGLTGVYNGRDTLAKVGADRQYGLQERQLDELTRQYNTDLEENIKTNYINAIISGHNSGIDPKVMRQMLDDLKIGIKPDGTISFEQPDAPGLNSTPLDQRPGTPEYEARIALERRRKIAAGLFG